MSSKAELSQEGGKVVEDETGNLSLSFLWSEPQQHGLIGELVGNAESRAPAIRAELGCAA